MGFAAQVQSPQTSGGKGQAPAPQAENKPNSNPNASTPQPMGKGGAQTNSATSGQPRMGAPNQYPNTVGQWDNTQQQQPIMGGGKGKG
jgi:hypothetical protein